MPYDAVSFLRCQLARKFKTFTVVDPENLKKKNKGGQVEAKAQAQRMSQVARNEGKDMKEAFDVKTMRAMASDFLQNFTVMFNQLQDFPMLNSKVFALQMLCLMKEVVPKEFLATMNKKAQTLAGCCVFDNDFHFHELTEAKRGDIIPLQNDLDHILLIVLKDIRKFEHAGGEPPGPWVVELTAIQPTGGLNHISVVKYDTGAEEVIVLCSSRGTPHVISRVDLERKVTDEEKTEVETVYPWLPKHLDLHGYLGGDARRISVGGGDRGSAGGDERGVSKTEVLVSSQHHDQDDLMEGGGIQPGVKELLADSEPVRLFYVVYVLRKSATATDRSVKYNAIKNAFLQFSQ